MKNPNLSHTVALRRGSSLAAGLAIVAATLFSLGCQSAPPLPPKEAMIPSRSVILSPGDVVRLTFAGAPEFNQAQKIRADGKLSLPQIGEVKAAGKSVPQFQSELVRLYESQLKNSDVLVTLESGITSVYMTGAVNRPGKLIFDRPTTILQAIAEAGGPTVFGSLKKVRIVRLENGQQQVQNLDLRSATKGAIKGPAAGPFYVRDGDIITIPQSAF